MLKKILFSLLLLTAPFAAFASVNVGGDYFLKGAEAVPDNLYVLGNTGTFAGTVNGDIVALASAIKSESAVKADTLLIGGDIALSGSVGDDARLLGGTVAVSGAIANDVVAIGGRVIILPTASIGGNLYIIGEDVSIQGKVSGDVRVYALRKTGISSAIGGTVESWGKTALLSGASIGGDFIYHTADRIAVPQDAKVKGAVLQGKIEEEQFGDAGSSFARGFFPLLVLMLLADCFLLLFLARDRTEETLQHILSEFGRQLLRGTLIVVCGPILIGFLLMSIVGVSAALVLACLYLSFLILGSAFGALILGAWGERLFFKQSAFPLSYRPILLGSLALSLIFLIPYVGLPVFLVLLLAGVGGLGTVGFGHLREMR